MQTFKVVIRVWVWMTLDKEPAIASDKESTGSSVEKKEKAEEGYELKDWSQ